jgi:hypothetical protein
VSGVVCIVHRTDNLRFWCLAWTAAILWLLFCAAPVAAQSIIYVNQAATGANNGSNWTDAYADLQDAIAAAGSGTAIWVANGVYTPGTGISSTFALKSGVALYGGFAGNESSIAQRDWESHITVLSGDLDGNDSFKNSSGIVTSTTGITGSNSYQVVTASGTGSSARLDGFTITAGSAQGAAGSPCGSACGGGLYIVGGSPTLVNLTFSANRAVRDGGAIYLLNSSPVLAQVTLAGNHAQNNGGGIYSAGGKPTLINLLFIDNRADEEGGGIYHDHSSPLLDGVIFQGNQAVWYGGGMRNDAGSNPTLTRVTFSENQATGPFGSGGGMYSDNSSKPLLTHVIFHANQAVDGGGMRNDHSSPTLAYVTFSANQAATRGGAMLNDLNSNPTLTHVTFRENRATFGGGVANVDSSPTFTNALFIGNQASGEGGGLYNEAGSKPILTNVTFSANRAGAGGALAAYVASSPVLQNSILWGNYASGAGDSLDQDPSSPVTIRYSLVEGITGAEDGNLGGMTDPLFVRPPTCDASGCTDEGNLRLQYGSPAIDQGDNSTISASTDLAGKPRFVAFHSAVAKVDLGAYETQVNSAPLFTSVPVTTAMQGQPYQYAVIVTDPDLDFGDFITVTIASAPAALSLSDSVILTGTPGSEDVGEQGVILQVQDSRGLTATQVFTLNVMAATGSITGVVLDAGSQPFPGVTVRLTPDELAGAAARAEQMTVTGPEGHYLFSGVLPGAYMLRFVPPGGGLVVGSSSLKITVEAGVMTTVFPFMLVPEPAQPSGARIYFPTVSR